jgi:EpsI family protein
MALQPWTRGDASEIGFKPGFENPSSELNELYQLDTQSVGMYIGYYRNQNYERKLVTSTNVLVPSIGKAWSQVEQGTVSVDFGGTPRTVRYAELRRLGGAPVSAPERLLVWQIYWIHGRLTTSDYLAKAYSAAYQLLGKGDDGAVLVLYAPVQGDGSARQALAAFAASQYGQIDALLRAAAASNRD